MKPKTPTTNQGNHPSWVMKRSKSRKTGAALIIALTFLVLISGLILALLTSVRMDRSNATAFASSLENQRLVDNSINVVISQIREATTKTGESWASQPGMIRTYGNTGTLTNAYRLYSSGSMISNATVDLGAENTAISTAWAGQSNYNARHADLNAPVYALRPDPSDPTQSIWQPVFPIADPSVAGIVEGFSADSSFSGVVAGTSNNRRLPMPVEWLYQLKDGSLIAPDQALSTAGKAIFSGNKIPSKSNPIVGRVAFWADDDTCKVNINTSSEGSFWDIPRSVALNEARMAWAVPVKGEFQAVAGHPATTSLSPVIGTLIGKPATPLIPFGTTPTEYNSYFSPYYGIAPRISNTTTSGTTTSQAGSQQTTSGSATGSGKPVVYDTDRLYTTTDELLFKPDRTSNAAGLTGPELAKRDFFLTATSRAPETSLFGTPRISLWPFQRLPSGANQGQTARDQLLSFCGKIAGKSYYFERASAGVGQNVSGVGSAGSLTLDYSSIPRNQELYSYLRNLMKEKIPGFGASFESKWSSTGTTQVATMAYDYFRSGLNLFQAPSGGRAGAYSWGYEIPVGTGNQGGYIMPIKINGTLGFGRSNTITEATVVFIASAADATSRKTTQMQTVMYFNLFRPTPNSAAAAPGVRFRVTSPFGINGEIRHKARCGVSSESGRNFSFTAVHNLLVNNDQVNNAPARTGGSADIDNQYPFYTAPVTVSGSTFDFPGGVVKIEILEPDTATPQVLQTLNLQFPPISGMPLPQAVDTSGNFSSTEARTFDARLALKFQIGIMRPGDIAKSVRFSNSATSPHKGDLRLLCLKETVDAGSGWFEPHPNYSTPIASYLFDGSGNALNAAAVTSARQNRFAQSLRNDIWISRNGNHYGWSDGKSGTSLSNQVAPQFLGAGFDFTKPAASRVTPGGLIAGLTMGSSSNSTPTPVIPQGLTEARNSAGLGDFTSNYGMAADGATLGVPDFGTLKMSDAGYFSELTWADDTGEASEPNRQAPSPVILGTLPSVDSTGNPAPWQTLLFCPNPAAGNTHPGFGTGSGGPGPATRAPFSTLPDHVFLDFWWMPAVDPYAVSDPLSTAGKINLNYQMAPFTHVTRSTGIQAVMKAVKLAAMPDANSVNYKQAANSQVAWGNSPQSPFSSTNITTKFNLNMSDSDGSLKGFKDRFTTGDIFHSASEICSIPLVPSGETTSTLAAWWGARRLTGDNLRESPYNALYSRITTKSNTFTVHYRVQPLKQVVRAGRSWAEWNEATDELRGEYRGATTLERYLDTSEQNIPDYATITTWPPPPIDLYYRFRILSTRQFAP